MPAKRFSKETKELLAPVNGGQTQHPMIKPKLLFAQATVYATMRLTQTQTLLTPSKV